MGTLIESLIYGAAVVAVYVMGYWRGRCIENPRWDIRDIFKG